MTAELTAMQKRLDCAPQVLRNTALDTAKMSMRLLIQSANIDRRLLDEKHWQEAMTHLHAMIKKNEKEAANE
jgi:hypothetical protein